MKWRRSAVAKPTTAAAIAVTVVVASAAAFLVYTNQGGGTPYSASSYALSSSGSASGGAIFVQVVHESGMAPIAGASVLAGPVPSPNDVTFTPAGSYTLTECVHEVPNGAVVGNGTIVVNGTTTTVAPCPLKEYTTDAHGRISITDPSGAFYFIEAGNNPDGWNDVVVGVEANNVINMTIPIPSGNVTVPLPSHGPSQSRLPVLWPQTTTVWPCGKPLPSGSTVVPQGGYGGEYVAYSYADLGNGTKAALNEDSTCSSLQG